MVENIVHEYDRIVHDVGFIELDGGRSSLWARSSSPEETCERVKEILQKIDRNLLRSFPVFPEVDDWHYILPGWFGSFFDVEQPVVGQSTWQFTDWISSMTDFVNRREWFLWRIEELGKQDVKVELTTVDFPISLSTIKLLLRSCGCTDVSEQNPHS